MRGIFLFPHSFPLPVMHQGWHAGCRPWEYNTGKGNMRKISYYIIALVVTGIALTSFWAYQKYFKIEKISFLYFTVEKGDIQESVRVRGEVVAQKEFELEFPFSGIVDGIYEKEGAVVVKGARLMSLDTKDFEIESAGLEAAVAQRNADLEKLRAGATSEEINVVLAQLGAAQVGRTEARNGLVDRIQDAYTKSDDAVRAKTDQLFSNPRSATPDLNITSDQAAKQSLSALRLSLEATLNVWSASLAVINDSYDLSVYDNAAKKNLTSVSDYLNALSPLVNNMTSGGTFSQATIDAYRADISSARTNINAALTNLAAAEEKLKLAEANVTLYENQLALKRAAARSEDITIAETRIREAESQLNAVREKIRKSVLYAPVAGKISKVHYEDGEVFRPGQAAVSLVTVAYKLQADVSELDIAKVKSSNGGGVIVELDAFPNEKFRGEVFSIDTKEIIKTEDKYYRVNILFDAPGKEVRSGMSADAIILSIKKSDVLKVSELAVYNDGKAKYLKSLLPGLTQAESEKSFRRMDVKTGITDGESVEIVSGAEEGQVVVVTAE